MKGLLKFFKEIQADFDKIALELDPSLWRDYSSRNYGQIEDVKKYFKSFFENKGKAIITELEFEILNDIENSIKLGQLTEEEKNIYDLIGCEVFYRYSKIHTGLSSQCRKLGTWVSKYTDRRGNYYESMDVEVSEWNNYKKIYEDIIAYIKEIDTSINDELLNEAKNIEGIEEKITEEINRRRREGKRERISSENTKTLEEKNLQDSIIRAQEIRNEVENREKRENFMTKIILGAIIIFVVYVIYIFS